MPLHKVTHRESMTSNFVKNTSYKWLKNMYSLNFFYDRDLNKKHIHSFSDMSDAENAYENTSDTQMRKLRKCKRNMTLNFNKYYM